MYTKQLETFLRVAELGSFSKAAQALYITPSAVIQQVNHFEREMQATLLLRTSRGVRLTEAGEAVCREGKALVKQCDALRRELQELQSRARQTLHVGTGLLRRCRLFNLLWPQFHHQHPEISLEVHNLETNTRDYSHVNLVESVYDLRGWDSWGFLEIGTVPIVCAVSQRHPLAQHSRLTYDDLRPYGLVTKCTNMVQTLQELSESAGQHGIPLTEAIRYDLSVFNSCELSQNVVQLPACWTDLYPELTIIPCEWDYMLRYGFFFCQPPSPAAEAFLEFARKQLAAGKLSIAQL